MSMSLKGYIGLAINWLLIILLIVYAVEHRKMMKNSEVCFTNLLYNLHFVANLKD